MTGRTMTLCARAVTALALVAGGCSAEDPRDGGGSDGGDSAPSDGAVDTGEDGGEAGGDAGGEAIGGPLTFAYHVVEMTAERRCDFDGDGTLDNSIADLGGVTAPLFIEYMNARMAAEQDPASPLLLHVPWVEDLAEGTALDAVVTFFTAEAPRALAQSAEGVPPEGPFYAQPRALDGCGEPLYVGESVSVEAGEVVVRGGRVPLPIEPYSWADGEGLEAVGTVSPDARQVVVDGCAYATIGNAGSEVLHLEGEETSILGLYVAGGRLVGIPTMPGIEPDVDVDGDGLESFLLDDSGRIEGCVDGDSTVIPGADCWRDPRMADGFSVSFHLEGRRAGFAGRYPAWERHRAALCPEGPPAESLLDSPVYDEVHCAGFEEPCEPFAPQPCCEPDLVCTGMNNWDYRCFRPGCEPPLCDYGGEPGICFLYSGYRGCYPLWRTAEQERSCEPWTTGCATEYGVTESTLCFFYESSGNRYCYEDCERSSGGCERGYACWLVPFTDDAVCTRAIRDE